MRKIFFLSVLSILTSCGGDSGSSSNPRQRFQDALQSLQRGQTSHSSTKGLTRSVDYQTGDISSAPVNEEGHTVILKIDGTNVYKYEMIKDLETGLIQKSVNLSSYSINELEEALKLPGAVIMGDFLKFNSAYDFEWEVKEGMFLKESAEVSISVNITKPLCEMTVSNSSKATIRTSSGSTDAPTVGSTNIETCGEILDSAALKAIDLSSVEFCDETSQDEYRCESSKDMSFLTADL